MKSLNSIKISNSIGMELEVSNFGATILSLKVQDKEGNSVNVVVGLENAEDYLQNEYLNKGLYLGASIGRFAGRISKGFKIENEKFDLYAENGAHLHGGKEGFDQKYWTVETIHEGDNPSVTLSYFSKHLEEGYPGNLKVSVTYQLLENALKITYRAETDKITHVNLTNHAYFNLDGNGTILNHELQINSVEYLEYNQELLPTGNLLPTKNSLFDYQQNTIIKKPDFRGLDTAFVCHQTATKKATLRSATTGIQLEVYTNQPAMVVYTPPQFSGLTFKENTSYTEYPAICFETQHFPDTPNHDHFLSTLLQPEDEYINESVFVFKIGK